MKLYVNIQPYTIDILIGNIWYIYVTITDDFSEMTDDRVDFSQMIIDNLERMMNKKISSKAKSKIISEIINNR